MQHVVDRATIQAFADEIAKRYHPEKIILFGSHAKGWPNPESDVDLMVIMDHARAQNVEQAHDIELELRPRFPIDILVRKPSEIVHRVKQNDAFIRSIIERGQLLYVRSNS